MLVACIFYIHVILNAMLTISAYPKAVLSTGNRVYRKALGLSTDSMENTDGQYYAIYNR